MEQSKFNVIDSNNRLYKINQRKCAGPNSFHQFVLKDIKCLTLIYLNYNKFLQPTHIDEFKIYIYIFKNTFKNDKDFKSSLPLKKSTVIKLFGKLSIAS